MRVLLFLRSDGSEESSEKIGSAQGSPFISSDTLAGKRLLMVSFFDRAFRIAVDEHITLSVSMLLWLLCDLFITQGVIGILYFLIALM